MFNNLQRIRGTCCKFKATKGQPSLLGCHNTILFLGHELEKRQRAVYEWENINVFLSLRQKLLIFEIFLTATKTGEKFDINFSPRPIEQKWKYIANFLWPPKPIPTEWVITASPSLLTGSVTALLLKLIWHFFSKVSSHWGEGFGNGTVRPV